MRLALTALLAVALVAAACGGDDDDSTDTTAAAAAATTTTAAPTSTTIAEVPLDTSGTPPVDYAGFRAQETACGAEAPPQLTPMEFAAPEDMGLGTDPVLATISTSCGDIVVELDPAVAPETVNSFVFLARQGYFDGSVSHRVAPGFVVQAGDPTATGTGGPGYLLPDEYPPEDFAYRRGVLAMANAGPGTTGSQFFIMLGDAPLPPQFSVFGEVVEGTEILDDIAALPLGVGRTGEQSVPLQTLYLDSVTVTDS